MVKLFEIPDGTPLVGSVSFGLIDRGTNVIQVRPSSACPLNCIFCSTDAGPCSKRRQAEYQVRLDHIMDWFRELVRIKGDSIEAHIDTVGDPFIYPHLEDLVHEIVSVSGVKTVSLQTHGYLMTEKNLNSLSASGLSRINLSLDAIDGELGKKLSGTPSYDIGKIIANARYALENTNIDVLLAPVWVHPLNDSQMDGLVELAKSIGAGKRGPRLGIQKCEFHRHGRRTREMKHVTWFSFYRYMKELGEKHGEKLALRPSDFGIAPANRLEEPFKKGEGVRARVIGPGWLKGESLAVSKDLKRTITVVGAELQEGEDVRVRLLRSKDNIFVGRPG